MTGERYSVSADVNMEIKLLSELQHWTVHCMLEAAHNVKLKATLTLREYPSTPPKITMLYLMDKVKGTTKKVTTSQLVTCDYCASEVVFSVLYACNQTFVKHA